MNFSITFTTLTEEQTVSTIKTERPQLAEAVMGSYGLDTLNFIREEIKDPSCEIKHISENCNYIGSYYVTIISEEQAINLGRFGGTNSLRVMCDPLSFTKYYKMEITPYYVVTMKPSGLKGLFACRTTWKGKSIKQIEVLKEDYKFINKRIDQVNIEWKINNEWLLHDWKEAGCPFDWRTIESKLIKKEEKIESR